MGLSEQQAAVVDVFDNSVNIAAGAGTGKTFTLTERIVRAIEVLSEQTDELPTRKIVAITFTDAAASELRSRVRQALFDRAKDDETGLFLACALDIDNAWISTIHGMASRILRENALQFGIDPAFEIMSSSDESKMASRALESTLSDPELKSGPLVHELFEEYDLYPKGFRSPSIIGFVDSVSGFAARVPGGVGGIDTLVPSLTPKEIIRKAYDNSFALQELLAQDVYAPGDTRKAQGWIEQIEEARRLAEEYFDSNTPDSFIDASFDKKRFAEILGAFPVTTNKFGNKKETGLDLERFRFEHQKLIDVAICGFGARTSQGILRIAASIEGNKRDIKAHMGSVLDNNDLLIVCNRKLQEHPDISARYKDRFFQIMVDEFQDTDRLQMQILRSIAKDVNLRGVSEELANVCTVGDMQQSIYRFRGGDVRESIKRKKELSAREHAQFSLSENYRTHEDVLRAVEVVFDRDAAFEDQFLRLTPACVTLDDDIASLYASKPRVVFDFIHHGQEDADGNTTNIGDARKAAAHEIASHFLHLSQSGVPLSKMALLLGVMTNSDLYAKAFREVGLSCKVTGGSVFTSTLEANLVKTMLAYGANADDEISLVNLLLSPLFNVSDDELIDVAFDSNGKRKVIANAIRRCDDDLESEATSTSLDAAVRSLVGFREDLKRLSVSDSLRNLLISSGFLYRLSENPCEQNHRGPDAEAVSCAANLSKAIDIVASFEEESFGINDLFQKYTEYLENEKEAPGSLATDGTGYISIMTVHSSKGLEFDHVAIAEMKDGDKGGNTVSLEIINDDAVMAFATPKSTFTKIGLEEAYGNFSKALKFDFPDIDQDDDLADVASLESALPEKIFSVVKGLAKTEELSESQRLLYVAMTRARETLYVSILSPGDPNAGNVYKGLFADLYDALLEYFDKDGNDFDVDVTNVHMPIRVIKRQLMPESMDGIYAGTQNDQNSTSRSFVIPVFAKDREDNVALVNYWRRGMYSYSSLSADVHDAEVDDAPRTHDEHDPVDIVDDTAASIATDLGSAFHRLAQIAILDSGAMGKPGTLALPAASLVENVSKSLGLSADHKDRLDKALDLWFRSETAQEFGGMLYRQAEVPFAISIEASSGSFTLEGEIDGLATDDGMHALLIDYKTGGSESETDDELHAKHLLQASCYALALMKAGFTDIDARFIRVEKSDPHLMLTNQEVRYRFCSDDMTDIESRIIAEYEASRQRHAAKTETD